MCMDNASSQPRVRDKVYDVTRTKSDQICVWIVLLFACCNYHTSQMFNKIFGGYAELSVRGLDGFFEDIPRVTNYSDFDNLLYARNRC